jgi:hypothetical protein
MAHHLVVTKKFLDFVRGDVIADAKRITEILATEYGKFVTKITAPNRSKG